MLVEWMRTVNMRERGIRAKEGVRNRRKLWWRIEVKVLKDKKTEEKPHSPKASGGGGD